ncbi:MAG TPA: sugar ABC transporter substrate-binding protein [Sedimentisphaerales bacterium]|nr:sugar ABC transporter substrate-binding protein [Sedimentisphaerales bacterium]
MRAWRWICVSVAVAALVAGGISCSRRGDAPARTSVCFAFQDLETEFWVAGHKAITETLKSKGIEVLERNANQDANRQLEQVRAAIARGVNGIIIIPQDGESAVTIVGEANKAGVPIGVFNRPPANKSNAAIVVVADNERISELAVSYMAEQARRLGRKATPLILVGDLGDNNAVARRKGFMNVIEKNPDLFNAVIEVPTKWDAVTAQANLEAAMQSNPGVDFIFTSSDQMYPQIRAVLEPLGKWKKIGDPGHVILGGVDGDARAARWMKEGYVDATGVQDLFYEADALLTELLRAIEAGEKTPNKWIEDPGFALTQANMAERAMDMWGYKLFAEQGPAAAR